MITRRIAVPALWSLITLTAGAQEPVAPKPESLIIYGDGFSFSVSEPKGWHGDIDLAKTYHANVVFYPAGGDPEKAALVQVALFHKQDERTADDLAYDVKSYEQQYPDLQKEDLRADHKDYRVFSKLVFVKKEFYQYISYVNAGEHFSDGFSVAMNIPERPAREEELKAYRDIIASLWMMGLK